MQTPPNTPDPQAAIRARLAARQERHTGLFNHLLILKEKVQTQELAVAEMDGAIRELQSLLAATNPPVQEPPKV